MMAQLRLTGDTENLSELRYSRVDSISRTVGDVITPCHMLGLPQTGGYGFLLGGLSKITSVGNEVTPFGEMFRIETFKLKPFHMWIERFVKNGTPMYYDGTRASEYPYTYRKRAFNVVVTEEGICLVARGFHIRLFDFWSWIWEEYQF